MRFVHTPLVPSTSLTNSLYLGTENGQKTAIAVVSCPILSEVGDMQDSLH